MIKFIKRLKLIVYGIGESQLITIIDIYYSLHFNITQIGVLRLLRQKMAVSHTPDAQEIEIVIEFLQKLKMVRKITLSENIIGRIPSVPGQIREYIADVFNILPIF